VSLSLYMDHHVPSAITIGLRHRGVDVLTAYEDAFSDESDENILVRATSLGRIVFSQDVDFLVLAHRWRKIGKTFAGVIFGRQENLAIGTAIDLLELIAKVSEPEQLRNNVQFIPLR
jgi:hypothetical protein